MGYLVGFDIGGTKIELVALNSNFETIYKNRIPTQRELGYEHILNQMQTLLTDLLHKHKIILNDLPSLGFSLPGTVDPKSRLMVLGNTRVLEGKSLQEDFKALTGFKGDIYAANDANCFSLAEYRLGLQLQNKKLLGVILGTGVGGGLIQDGVIYEGSRGSAIEIGHMKLFESPNTCYCGQSGCVEQVLSGPGIQADYYSRTNISKTPSEILQLPAEQGLYLQRLGYFLGTVNNVLDVDVIVLGGGLSRQKFLYGNSESLIVNSSFLKSSLPPILSHKISDSSGSIGAALLSQA